MTTGDLVRIRRVQVRPYSADGPAYDWVDDFGIVLKARHRKPGQHYLVRVC